MHLPSRSTAVARRPVRSALHLTPRWQPNPPAHPGRGRGSLSPANGINRNSITAKHFLQIRNICIYFMQLNSCFCRSYRMRGSAKIGLEGGRGMKRGPTIWSFRAITIPFDRGTMTSHQTRPKPKRVTNPCANLVYSTIARLQRHLSRNSVCPHSALSWHRCPLPSLLSRIRWTIHRSSIPYSRLRDRPARAPEPDPRLGGPMRPLRNCSGGP